MKMKNVSPPSTPRARRTYAAHQRHLPFSASSARSAVKSLLAAPILALAACHGSGDLKPLAAGDPAPAYAAPTLAGDTVSLASLRGHPVLLNLWATWCIPCRQEMPALDSLQHAYAARGLRVVGVNLDESGADEDVKGFIADHGITFTVLRDPDERVVRTFRTSGVPETFLIGADGTVVHRWIGEFQPMAPDARAMVEKALDGAGKES